MSKTLIIWETFMLAIRQWILMLVFICIAPLSLAEDGAMSTQKQCAKYGVYQDSGENWVDCGEDFSEQQNDQQQNYQQSTDQEESYKNEYETYVEDPYFEEPYVEESYVEEPYVDEPYVEQPYEE
jgi:hypothetical protein